MPVPSLLRMTIVCVRQKQRRPRQLWLWQLEALLLGVAAGDSRSLEELYHRTRTAVYGLVLSYLKHPQDAEDVTQTVFLKVLERRPDLEPGKERAWLFRVAVNECRSLWRRLKLRRTAPLEEALAVAAPQEEPVLRQVMELKAGEREILYLIYYEGFSTRETASLLGISQTAVTTRLQRARKKLRERLEEEGRP